MWHLKYRNSEEEGNNAANSAFFLPAWEVPAYLRAVQSTEKVNWRNPSPGDFQSHKCLFNGSGLQQICPQTFPQWAKVVTSQSCNVWKQIAFSKQRVIILAAHEVACTLGLFEALWGWQSRGRNGTAKNSPRAWIYGNGALRGSLSYPAYSGSPETSSVPHSKDVAISVVFLICISILVSKNSTHFNSLKKFWK